MLKILTINAALLDVRILSFSVYRPLNHIKQRLRGLVESILDLQADIVFIQELFHHDLQHYLYSMLASEYPYVTGLGKLSVKTRLDNELVTLSKKPLSQGEFTRFSHAAPEEKYFMQRGLMRMKLKVAPGKDINLFNIHLTAGGLNQHPESKKMIRIRSAQIQQLLKLIPGQEPTIIAGDFNTGPDSSTENYTQLLESGLIDSFTIANGHGISWDPDNPLVAIHDKQNLSPQRVDHIFMNNAAKLLLDSKNAEIVMTDRTVRTDQGQNVPVSDHYGVLVTFDKINI